MRKSTLRSYFLVATLAVLAVVIAACGSSVAGKYHSADGSITVVLNGDGTGTLQNPLMGSVQCKYTVKDNQVMLAPADGNGEAIPFTIAKDGGLDAPLFGHLVKGS